MASATETLRKIFKDIANSIRRKDGTTEAEDKIHPENYASRIDSIETGYDTSDATVVASDILSGKIGYGVTGRIEGSLVPETGFDTSDATVVPSDILSGEVAYGAEGRIVGTLIPETGLDTSDATAEAGDILAGATAYGARGKIVGTMPNAGSITGQLGTTSGANWATSDPNRGSGIMSIVSVNQTAGYTPGISNGSLSVTVPANRLLKGRTITPGTSAINVGQAEDILYGAINVAGDSNLIPSNIKSGVSIFGVSGTISPGSDGPDTSDATATADDIAKGKTAYGPSGKITGTVETKTTDIAKLVSNAIFGKYGSTAVVTLQLPYEYTEDTLIRSGVTVTHRFAATSLGDATATDVASDKTFTSKNGLKVVGTVLTHNSEEIRAYFDNEPTVIDTTLAVKYEFQNNPELFRPGSKIYARASMSSFGDAQASDVAFGKTFTSKNGLKVTGSSVLEEADITIISQLSSSTDLLVSITAAEAHSSVTNLHIWTILPGDFHNFKIAIPGMIQISMPNYEFSISGEGFVSTDGYIVGSFPGGSVYYKNILIINKNCRIIVS